MAVCPTVGVATTLTLNAGLATLSSALSLLLSALSPLLSARHLLACTWDSSLLSRSQGVRVYVAAVVAAVMLCDTAVHRNAADRHRPCTALETACR